jgi:hypothetical protein
MISKRNTETPAQGNEERRRTQMVKMSIRKAGTIRLTAACCGYHVAA